MKTDIKKHIKILFNDYLNDSSAVAEDNLVNKLTEFYSSIPTHKDETKIHDIFCATNYFKDVHRGIKFTHCTCREQSVPQPLKLLSDEEKKKIIFEKIDEGDLVEKRIIEKLGNYTDRDDVVVGTICNILYDNFSLPVDNTVSETEKVKTHCICGVNNTTGSTKVECCNNCGKPLEKESWYSPSVEETIKALMTHNESLTSQISLYNNADNILKDIVMSKSNEIGEDLTKRVVKILEDLQTLIQE